MLQRWSARFDMEVAFFKPFTYSLALVVIASVWGLKYRAARRGRKYSEGRQAIEKDDSFRIVGKVIFVAMNAFTLVSFWSDSNVLLLFHKEGSVRLAGMIVLAAATVLYVNSIGYLGDNYSPCFDSHLPFRIVTRGPYKYIRHPLYLANILQGVAYILTSGSFWVLALAGYGIFRILRALIKEESYLSKTFTEYERYRARTSRLIPFVY